ncbi:hypothetical protein DL98DRAFT_655764 [Cadophora sp. DSE1049]|nr:hypothetical protein DL98DRAFT_655764 [Cadophora sp. DSE1049]
MSPVDSMNNETLQTLEIAADRHRYGHPFLEILASNNEDCLLQQDPYSDSVPRKRLHVMTDRAFGNVFNNHIRPKLLAILDPSASSLPQFQELHAVTMDCGGNKMCDVVLVVFPKDSISIHRVKELVIEIDSCIKSEWAGNKQGFSLTFVNRPYIQMTTFDLIPQVADLTYATPVRALLEDIRVHMGWEYGSIELL